MSAAVAITAITTVLNGKSTPFRKPNAAPLLRTWVKSMNPGMIVVLSCSFSDARTIALVAGSTATMIIGSQTSRWRRGLTAASCSPAWTISPSVLSIDRFGQRVLTPVAEAGPGRIGRDRSHVAPAPFALHAARPLDRDARPRLGVHFSVHRRRPQLDLRHDEQHRQLLRVGLEPRELRRRRRHDHLRLQRAADLLVLAERLNLREHLLAEIDQHLPAREQLPVGEGGEILGLREQRHVNRLVRPPGQETP